MSARLDASASDLARVRSLFESWRARRSSPRQRIPQDLWDAALSLLDHLPLRLVARELGLSAFPLRSQRDALSPQHPSPDSPPHFVPLPPLTFLSDHRQEPTPSRLVLERSDGARLTLTLPAEQSDRLDALCRAFLASQP